MTTSDSHSKRQRLPPLKTPEGLEAKYINLVRIAHSPAELVFDFAHMLPGVEPSQVCSRIVMSPLSAKLFQRALVENLMKFESAYGEIKIPGGETLADSLFQPQFPPEDQE
jgi:hypothetical protein